MNSKEMIDQVLEGQDPRDTILDLLCESSNWVGAKLSDKQEDWLNKIRQKYGNSMIAFTVDSVKDAVFVDANKNIVRINKDASGGLMNAKQAMMLRDDRFARGNILKHKDDIKADKDYRKKTKARYKDLNKGIFVDKFLPSISTKYKYDGKNWYRPDGKGGWIRHTRKKGHPSNTELSDKLDRGDLRRLGK